ncbi:MAG: efflux RND transporter permease subunit [Ignavibacteria bacterium]|jgi:HAE1 family hydrophobic/amphiphilic exporter-1|nr:efflux RND transporter permease subunit [Ignavibacteria bacterium]MCU7502145.1 efflux RND transporter permease subunit [Ignavibacteria bacterium]MCU7515547.1 efflux RND transporter permease subunit [Ignavibacteria bacterium]
MTLTELSIKRPSFVIVIFSALALLAVFGYSQLKYELLPNINIPWVVVTTVYPGASPGEVENNVTKTIEDALSGLDKVERIMSTSYEGISVISIEFKKSADVDVSFQEAQRKINGMMMNLPKEVRTPVLQKISLQETPILQVGATADMSSKEFYQFIKDQIQPAISRVDGVGLILLTGGQQREIKINLDAQKISAYGLSIARIAQAVNTSNLDFPTGKIQGAQQQFIVRVAGKFSSIDDLRNLTVGRSAQGGNIRLEDVAEIEDGTAEIETLNRLNGKNSIGIAILKQAGANSVQVSNLVRKELSQLEKDYESMNLKFDVAQDQSLFTVEASEAVQKDLLIAILLVAAVMFLFLHSIRNSFIVMIAIPTSLTAAFVVMWAFDFSLNLMTLLALSLVIGILVDDSIVVLENIYHHLEKKEDRKTAALKGRNEIGFAAVSITFVDVVVFVPLSLVSGMIGDIMREFAILITVSTLMSLFVSFTVTPVLASRFSKLEVMSPGSLMGKIAAGFERFFRKLTAYYLNMLKWSLKNPWKVLAGATIISVASMGLPAMGLIGSEFMKQPDSGEFIVVLEMSPGSTLSNTNRVTRQVEEIISELPGVKKILTNVGRGANRQTVNNASEITVTLLPKEERQKSTKEIADLIQEKARLIPDARVYINQIGVTGESGEAPVFIQITGRRPDSIWATAGMVTEALKKTPGITDIKMSSEQGKPETRVDIDRQKMANFGITVFDVGTTLQVALTGNDDSKYREGQFEYPIRIMLDRFDRSNMDDISKLSLVNSSGAQVQLQQFASVYQSLGPTKLERQNRNPSMVVSAYTDGRPIGSLMASFSKILGDKKAQGTFISLEGDEKMRSEGMDSLMLALIAAIIFVYLIMVLLFDSFVYPFVVLFSIPLALIGAMVALALTNNALSIFSMLGVIMMIGLVAKNAILIVERTNFQRGQQASIHEALIEAGSSRIRPILMTTLAMVFGMLPIATASGAGSEWKNGLAWALIGGLTSSMFLTLIVVPVVYTKIDRLRRSIPALFKAPFPVKRHQEVPEENAFVK